MTSDCFFLVQSVIGIYRTTYYHARANSYDQSVTHFYYLKVIIWLGLDQRNH